MSYHSILYTTAADDAGRRGVAGPPAHFVDLALDQVVADVTASKAEYRLEPEFHRPLADPDSVRYRQEVVRDLQRTSVHDAVTTFAEGMRTVRERLGERDDAHYRFEKERWLLDAVVDYCQVVRRLADDLGDAAPRSRGFAGLRGYLHDYLGSDDFAALSSHAEDVRRQLSGIEYEVTVHGNSVRVRRYAGEADYSAKVLATFTKFAEGAAKDYRARRTGSASLNHVEAQILDGVASLFPDAFADLDRFCEAHRDFLDERIAAFDREVQFYVGYLDHVRSLERSGVRFALPELAPSWQGTYAHAMFDAALAARLGRQGRAPVVNDVGLEGEERLIVVTGPNQGGKTTFARAFGQIHYLAALGLPVPAAEARVHLCDTLHTHFERQERSDDLRGKLHEELERVRGMLERATRDTLVVMNEAFSSTTAGDALLLSRRVLAHIDERGALGLVVTFLDELASLHRRTVSMVGTVDPADPAIRTFHLVRRPADGRAYAIAIARKHGLTRDALAERLDA